jgi:hypothetical protein
MEFGAAIQENRRSPEAPILSDEDAVRARFDHPPAPTAHRDLRSFAVKRATVRRVQQA